MAKRSLKALNPVATQSPQEQGISAGIQPVEQKTEQLAKRADPAFIKFTTYIRKTTHLGVKTRLVSKEKELSDLVEELLSNWLKENDSFKA